MAASAHFLAPKNMKKLLALPLFAYCAFATCGVVSQQTAQQIVRQADTLRVARPPWLFVPLDSLRAVDILPLMPIRSVFADIAVPSLRADSVVHRKEVKPLRIVPVRQALGAGGKRAQ